MLDWNWRILRNLLIFAAVLGLASVFAVATDTLRFAAAGGALALALQVAIYWAGNRMGVRQHFDPSRPLHHASRWDNMAFRTAKVVLEMLLLSGMLYLGVTRFAQPAGIASFVVFGVILTGVPLPLLAWAFVRKVVQPSVRAMSGGTVRPMPTAPARTAAPAPTVRPAPPAISQRGAPPALPPSPPVRLAPPAGRPPLPQALRPPPAPAPPDFDDSVL